MKQKMTLKNLVMCSAILIFTLVGINSVSSNADNLAFKSTGDVKAKDGEVLFSFSDLLTLEQKINTVGSELDALENSVGNNKEELLNILSMNPNLDVNPDASFGEITSYVQNMTSIPEDTYFYEDGTEGSADTIVRYKKINGEYFLCNANGVVSEGATPVDITDKTLEPYNATAARNMSAGAAGYASNSFLLGDGSDNAAYYAQGVVDGLAQALDNLQVSYQYHVHQGDGTIVDGCYGNLTKTERVQCGLKCTDTSWEDGGRQYIAATCSNGHFNDYQSYIGKACPQMMNKTVNYIGPVCGKTEETVESVTIIY